MRKILTFILTILYSNILFAQSFQIGHTTVTFIDTSRNNRSIATEVYYPADVAGDDEPITITTNDKFPVVSFGHGFVMTWNAYQNIWDAVVQEGFIIAFPKTEGGLAPSHAEFGKDLAFVISELSTLSQDTSSLFYNRVDTMNCVMGHSMGGGAAFLAAQFDPSIKTIATLAAAETNPSAIQAAASLSIPSLIIAGGNDCVTPPPANQVPMYDSLQSSCKTYVSINGGSHCQMADNNFLCSIGEATCTPQPTITRPEQHVVISNYLLPWLKYELKGDCFSGAQFDSLITTDTSIIFQKTCLLCNASTSIENNSTLNLEIFPNPFHQELFIQNDQHEKSQVLLDLFAMNGTRIYSESFTDVKANEKLKLNFEDNVPAGIYLLKVTMDDQHSFRKILKH